MDAENTPPEDQDAGAPVTELSLLRERAQSMGISIPGNIGIENLKKKIDAKLAGGADTQEGEAPAAPASKRKLTRAEMDQELRDKLKKEKLFLVRCKIYNLNPGKRDLRGEIITVANKYLGTIRKFIPFGEHTENGYHIPKIIYDDLKSRRFQSVTTKTKRGKIEVDTRMVPEYNIEIMPSLTREELKELALKQAGAERFGAE